MNSSNNSNYDNHDNYISKENVIEDGDADCNNIDVDKDDCGSYNNDIGDHVYFCVAIKTRTLATMTIAVCQLQQRC